MMTQMPGYVLMHLIDDIARRQYFHTCAHLTCNWLHTVSKRHFTSIITASAAHMGRFTRQVNSLETDPSVLT